MIKSWKPIKYILVMFDSKRFYFIPTIVMDRNLCKLCFLSFELFFKIRESRANLNELLKKIESSLGKLMKKQEYSNGCICQRCESVYKVDFNISDSLWDKISIKYNLLCGPCIAELIEEMDEFLAFEISEIT